MSSEVENEVSQDLPAKRANVPHQEEIQQRAGIRTGVCPFQGDPIRVRSQMAPRGFFWDGTARRLNLLESVREMRWCITHKAQCLLHSHLST